MCLTGHAWLVYENLVPELTEVCLVLVHQPSKTVLCYVFFAATQQTGYY